VETAQEFSLQQQPASPSRHHPAMLLVQLKLLLVLLQEQLPKLLQSHSFQTAVFIL
jgi:hypothetical protein